MKEEESIEFELEAEAIQYIARAISNFATYDNSASCETPRFISWLSEWEKGRKNGL